MAAVSDSLREIDNESVFSQHAKITQRDLERVGMTQSGLTQDLSTQADEDTSASKAGVIKKIVLQNFMCHGYFELKLGPKINFIIGRNGSGKSAILTGITVGLGCRANEIDRGKNLRNLIKRGTRSAKIAITFANEGDVAFEPEKYGSEITVERLLRMEGQNTYAIKSESGKVISNKKVDLDEILDYFDITVNNPLAFLSQTDAKTFLAQSSNATKYAFLMKGIQFDQVKQEYDHTLEQLYKISQELTSRAEALNALKQDERKASEEYAMYSRSKNLRQAKKLYTGKLIWHEVVRSEAGIEKLEAGRAQAQAGTIEVLNNIEAAKNSVVTKIESLGQEKLKCASLKESMTLATEKKQEIDRTYAKLVQRLNDIEDRINELNSSRGSKVNQIARLKQKAKAEEKRLEAIKGGSMDSLKARLKELQVKVDEIEKQREEESAKSQEDSMALDDLRREAERDRRSKASEVQKWKEQITYFQSSKKDKYAVYGRNFVQFMNAISQTKFKKRPIGPLGAHMFLKPQYTKFSSIIEKALPVEAFVVDNFEDQRKLRSLMGKFNCTRRVIVRKSEYLDLSSSQIIKDEGLTRIMDTLEFDSDDVKFALVDVARIECDVLEADVTKGQSIVENVSKVRNCFCLNDHESAKKFFVNRWNGAFRVDPVFYDRNWVARVAEVGQTSFSVDHQIKKFQLMISEKQAEIGQSDLVYNRKISTVSDRVRAAKQVQAGLKRKQVSLINEMRNLRSKLEEGDDTSRAETYYEEASSIEEELQLVEGSLQGAKDDLDTLKQEIRKADSLKQDARDESKKAINDFRVAEQKVDQINEDLETLRSHIAKDEALLKRREVIVAQIDANIADQAKKLESFKEKAVQYCTLEEAQIDLGSESLEQIKSQLKAIDDEIERANSRLTVSPEEIVKNYQDALDAFKEAASEMNKAADVKRKLEKSLKNRQHNSRIMREMLCMAASQDFSNSLAIRGFEGVLKFDHKEKTLRMLVSKDNGPVRDVTSLSGGEKSFTQISLLLSIWKIMRPKIKGLDEFDVFMDTVNRRVSMQLILQNLRQSPKYQTLFITPLDVSNITGLDSDDVSIYQLKDPERLNNSTNN